MRLCRDASGKPTLGDLVVAVTDFAMEMSDNEEQAYRLASAAINDYLRRSKAEGKIRRRPAKYPGLTTLQS
ncbi:MAG TPA: hypothetical protein VIB79_30925 [Candidatus Binatia bacterium]|jgi:hypothetical protein